MIVTDRRNRVGQVGLGARSMMFTRGVTETYREHCRMVALCDVNPTRMAFCNRRFGAGDGPFPTYTPDAFDDMVRETGPDTVIVSSVDSTHAATICRALELGCNVITEKPMTTDAPSCRRILQTMRDTGRNVTVAFNSRYRPDHSRVKQVLEDGAAGTVLSVAENWTLDTTHGADYFRRWHRYRRYSGSLLVHKSTHHFDILNWWLNDSPEEVFARGSLRYYRPETAERLGLGGRGERCLNCPVRNACPVAFDLAGDEGCRALYLDAEKDDGYIRDRCVFDESIDIWDTMSVSVRYRSGVFLTYSLCAYAPCEGYHVAINGTHGRVEHAVQSTGLGGLVPGENATSRLWTRVWPLFGEPHELYPLPPESGHGGGDSRLVRDLFDPEPGPDPLGRRAGALQGALSILIGVAAAQSIDTGEPVRIADLLGEFMPPAPGE